jgi:hypothetical protein
MSLNIDHSKAFRTPLQLRALVEAIKVAGEHDESDWIEWKSSYDLNEKSTKVTLARHILGMANRSVQKSAQTAGGYGYIAVGIEPGNTPGISTIDLADLEAGIRPYLGTDGPEWIPSYVTIDGKQILIISVDPPSDGDPIHTLRKDFDKYFAGMVFVRRIAKTVPAGPGEIAQLTQRARNQQQRQSINLEARESPCGVPSWSWLSDAISYRIEKEREAVAEAGRRPTERLFGASIRDVRSPEQYQEEASEYLERFANYVSEDLIRDYIHGGRGPLFLRVQNPQEFSYQNVRVEIDLPQGVSAFLASDYIEEPWRPRRPLPMGRDTMFTSLTSSGIVTSPHLPKSLLAEDVEWDIQIERIVCNIKSLRAEENLPLPLVHLMASEGQEPSTKTAAWSITADNAVGRTRGELEFTLTGDFLPSPDFSRKDW